MRVLIVEDEKNLTDAIERRLTAEGIDCDVSHDGVDGQWRAEEGAFDVIMLDIMLPKRNGYEVCRNLREQGITTPVLMLTAKDGEYDIAEGLELGADDYLTKPFSFVVLIARLHALARRGGGSASVALQAGALSLDPAQRTCAFEGEAIDLTPREFSLLEALLRREGDVVPKRELLDLVWGFDYEGSANVVEVYVKYLRTKIDERFDQTIIKTVRGIGYQVAA